MWTIVKYSYIYICNKRFMIIIIAIKDPVNLTENITNKSRTPAVYKIFCEQKL